MAEGAFLGFRTLISGTIIKIVYAIGLVLITLAGLLWMAYPFAIYDGAPPEPIPYISGGLFIITAGNIIWRLLCEGVILFFSLHELLASLEKTSRTTNELLEGVARQLTAIETNTEARHAETISRKPAPAHAKSSESVP